METAQSKSVLFLLTEKYFFCCHFHSALSHLCPPVICSAALCFFPMKSLDETNISSLRSPTLPFLPVRSAGSSLSPCTASRFCKSCPPSCCSNTAPQSSKFAQERIWFLSLGDASLLGINVAMDWHREITFRQKTKIYLQVFLSFPPILDCSHTRDHQCHWSFYSFMIGCREPQTKQNM